MHHQEGCPPPHAPLTPGARGQSSCLELMRTPGRAKRPRRSFLEILKKCASATPQPLTVEFQALCVCETGIQVTTQLDIAALELFPFHFASTRRTITKQVTGRSHKPNPAIRAQPEMCDSCLMSEDQHGRSTLYSEPFGHSRWRLSDPTVRPGWRDSGDSRVLTSD